MRVTPAAWDLPFRGKKLDKYFQPNPGSTTIDSGRPVVGRYPGAKGGATMEEIGAITCGKCVRKRSVWVIALGSVVSIFLIVLLSFVGLVFRQFRKDIPTPTHPDSSAQLLVLAEAASRHEAKETPSSTSTAPNANAWTTLLAPTGGTSQTLKFKPYIPDSAMVQADLRAKATEINERFDRVFLRVEEYERVKDCLAPKEAVEVLNSIAKEDREAQDEIDKATGGRMTGETMEALRVRNQDFRRWWDVAGMEGYARCGMWLTAGSFAEGYYRNDERDDWARQQLARGDGQPVFLSDFDGATGYEDYNRAVYYYQQEGGFNGFMNTMSLYYGRKHQQFSDFFSDPLPKNYGTCIATIVIRKRGR